MSHIIKASELCEIDSILRRGKHSFHGAIRIRIEFLGLAFSKYLLYSDIKSWRQGASKPFDTCPLGKGQRSQAIRYLNDRGVIVYESNRRCRSKDFKEKLKQLERELLQ